MTLKSMTHMKVSCKSH